jgi:hypothetical protein
MSTPDLIVYSLYLMSVVICVVKVGLLARVRTALFDLPPDQRRLVTILSDNNLIWCLTMALTGGVIVARVLGWGNPVVGRYAILGTLVLGSGVGLVRLGNWFLYDDGTDDRGRPASALTDQEEIARLILLLQRRERRIEAQGEKETQP